MIARGTGTGAGIRAVDDGTMSDDDVVVDVSFTNYSSLDDTALDDVAVTLGAGNQTPTAPLFLDAPALDFSQLAASITRNAGGPNGTVGALDFEGEPRTMGTQIDIGGR